MNGVSSGGSIYTGATDEVAAVTNPSVWHDQHTSTGELGPPAEVDILTSTRTTADGGETAVDLPSSDVLVFELTGGHRVVARPSGTEPKVKIYVDVRETIATDETLDVARSRADGRIANLMDAILSRL